MKNKSICILDYGSGNVRSVYNIIHQLTNQVHISNEPEDIIASSHIILPGVGAFGAAMEKIHKFVPLSVLENEVFAMKKPFLGICVGMQVLATIGREFGDYKGLNWIPGIVQKIDTGELPLPHIGWNNCVFRKESPLVQDFNGQPDFYFVHSYAYDLSTVNEHSLIATTNYGADFCSILQKDNIFGVQFHPEKSQKAGRLLLANFLAL